MPSRRRTSTASRVCLKPRVDLSPDRSANQLEVSANLTFPAVRFVKVRAITTAAIDMAQTAVELSLSASATEGG